MFSSYLRKDKTPQELFDSAKQNYLSLTNFGTTIELGVRIATIPMAAEDCDSGMEFCQCSDQCKNFVNFDFYEHTETGQRISEQCRAKFPPELLQPGTYRSFGCNCCGQWKHNVENFNDVGDDGVKNGENKNSEDGGDNKKNVDKYGERNSGQGDMGAACPQILTSSLAYCLKKKKQNQAIIFDRVEPEDYDRNFNFRKFVKCFKDAMNDIRSRGEGAFPLLPLKKTILSRIEIQVHGGFSLALVLHPLAVTASPSPT